MSSGLAGEIVILAAKSVLVCLITLAVFWAIRAVVPDFPDDDGERM